MILDFLSSGITCRTRDRRMWRRHYRQLTLGPEVKCSIKKGGGGQVFMEKVYSNSK